MATTDDPVRPEPHDAFPVDNPVQALMRDHDLVRKLADTYQNTQSADVKKQAATQLVQAIHVHSRLEEGVFYPGVRRVDPNLIARFEEDHLAVDDLLATLQGMSMDEPRAEPLVNELIAAVLSHIRQEEEQLFPELRQARLDLTAVGLQMQAFEANLVHLQAQLSDQGARR
ncbi:MAG: hemerythrin domain-containing protein [Massilia sp.]|nr:hemerythrin domain-containing protein [Massilia sp.]